MEPMSAKERKPKSWIFYAALAAVLVSTAVTLGTVFGGPSHIEDINGDDTSLAVITMEEILSDRHSSTMFMTTTQRSGSSSGVTGYLSECDVRSLSLTCKKFSGIKTAHATIMESDTMLLHVRAEVASGNLELIITLDGEYYCHVPVGGRQVIRIVEAAGKLVELRIAGESAQMELSVSRVFLDD